jgi:Xaa-Pro aminopeptidase
VRLSGLQEKLKLWGLDAILVCNPFNCRYLSGFSGGADAWLIITACEAFIISDFRYRTQIAQEVAGYTYIEASDRLISSAASLMREKKIKRCGYEPDRLTVDIFQCLQHEVRGCVFKPVQEALAAMRSIKDEAEIRRIACAAAIADRAFMRLLDILRAGMSEKDIACELDYLMRKEGGDANAFATIVASGANAAKPHHLPSMRRLQKGDFVTIDFGCVFEGYCSDATRTLAVGKVSEEMVRVYALVLEAQRIALRALEHQRDAVLIDAAARDYFEEHGCALFFGHGLGHGVGLEVHEAPRVSKRSRDRLQAGMVTSIEPGLYYAGQYGVRIEDLCLIKETGYENLTSLSKELIIL